QAHGRGLAGSRHERRALAAEVRAALRQGADRDGRGRPVQGRDRPADRRGRCGARSCLAGASGSLCAAVEPSVPRTPAARPKRVLRHAPRSWHFVPGAVERYVAKLEQVPRTGFPDAVVFDLEDGVAALDLPQARRRVAAIANDPAAASRLPAVVAVRTHAVAHEAFEADLQTLGPLVTTLVLPKVAGPNEVAEASRRMLAAGLAHVGIVAII